MPSAAGHDVGGVQERVEPAREHPLREGRIVDAVHHHEQLVERQPRAAAHAGEREVECRGDSRLQAGRAETLGRTQFEHPLAPAPRLEDQIAAACDGSARPEEEVVVDVRRGEGTGRCAAAECLPAHPDCVDLVDEDDALAAPLAGEPLRLPGEVADDDRVDADEGLSEAGARDRDERGVEPGRDRLREHRLSGPGGAEKEQSALALASRALERLARLPKRDDPPDLLLGLHLAANVLELDSPLRVPGLEALDLRDAHQQHRAHEDREVGDEQERDEDDLREHRRIRERRQEPAQHVADGAPPRAAADQPDDGDHGSEHDRESRLLPPVPRAPPADHVLVAQLLAVGAEEARPRDQLAEEQIGEAAEHDHDAERRQERPERAPAVVLLEPDEERRARQQRDHGRGSRQAAPLVGELGRNGGLRSH